MGGAFKSESNIVQDPNILASPVKMISTTIKRKWINQILLGAKTSELKAYTKHWKDRLEKYLGDHGTGECYIKFLCGRLVYKYWVMKIELHPDSKNIDGKICQPYFEIFLHGRACVNDDFRPCVKRRNTVNKSLQEVAFCNFHGECIAKKEESN